MKITCPCEKVVLTLPDDKLPPVGRFAVGCPECGKMVRISRSPYGTRASFAQTPPTAPPDPEQPKAAEGHEAPAASERESQAPPRPCFVAPEPTPGDRPSVFLALADPAWGRAAEAFFREAGYFIRRAPKDRDMALTDLRVNGHAACVLEDAPELAAFLAETLTWPGRVRRETACLLVGDAPDFDLKSAFYKGADAVINRTSLDRAPALFALFLRRAGQRREFLAAADANPS